MITVGNWLFYPECMTAVHVANGAVASFKRFEKDQGGSGWNGTCWQCPTNTDFLDLSDWFGKWIKGEVK